MPKLPVKTEKRLASETEQEQNDRKTIIDKANRFDKGMKQPRYSRQEDEGRRGSKGQRNICNNAVPTRESGMNRMADAVDQECSIESRRDESGGAWRDHHEEQPSRRNNPNKSKEQRQH